MEGLMVVKTINKKREKELARVEFLLGARPQDGIERYRWDIVREAEKIFNSWINRREEVAGRKIGAVRVVKPIDRDYQEEKHIIISWYNKVSSGRTGAHIAFSKNQKKEAELKNRGICFVLADPIGNCFALEKAIRSAMDEFFSNQNRN